MTAVTYAADLVVLGTDNNYDMYLLLIQRGWEPHLGAWALPGGHVDADETAAVAAVRELAEETGVVVDPAAVAVRLVGVYDAPDRDPRGRVVSVAYCVQLDTLPTAVAADGERDARWWPINDLPELAFDHVTIVTDALQVVAP